MVPHSHKQPARLLDWTSACGKRTCHVYIDDQLNDCVSKGVPVMAALGDCWIGSGMRIQKHNKCGATCIRSLTLVAQKLGFHCQAHQENLLDALARMHVSLDVSHQILH